MIPSLVAAMAFLTTLAGAGGLEALALAKAWQAAASPALTIQAPDQEASAVTSVLGPSARRLSAEEISASLRPWLGEDAPRLAIGLPAVFLLRGTLSPDVVARLARTAPRALVRTDGGWHDRLDGVAAGLRACAALIFGAVATAAAGVVVAATHAMLAIGRETIAAARRQGAAVGALAGACAARIAWRAAAGGVLGVALAVPVLIWFVRLAAVFQLAAPQGSAAAILPPLAWGLMAALPLLGAGIAWMTAQATVRLWLGPLP